MSTHVITFPKELALRMAIKNIYCYIPISVEIKIPTVPDMLGKQWGIKSDPASESALAVSIEIPINYHIIPPPEGII